MPRSRKHTISLPILKKVILDTLVTFYLDLVKECLKISRNFYVLWLSKTTLRALIMPDEICSGTFQTQNAFSTVFAHSGDNGKLLTNLATHLVKNLLALATDLVLLESLYLQMTKVLALPSHK